jgi:hypothetical protein
MPSSGMWPYVDLVRTNVSEERISSISVVFTVKGAFKKTLLTRVVACDFEGYMAFR